MHRMDTVKKQENSYSVSLAAHTVGVSQRQLYYWEFIGIIKPAYIPFGSYSYRRYTQQDINQLLKVKHLLDAGYTLRAAAQKVKEKNGGPTRRAVARDDDHSFQTQEP